MSPVADVRGAGQISKGQCSQAPLGEQEPTARAEAMLSEADKIGCRKLITAGQVAAVREHQLRLMHEPDSLPEKERDHHGGPARVSRPPLRPAPGRRLTRCQAGRITSLSLSQSL